MLKLVISHQARADIDTIGSYTLKQHELDALNRYENLIRVALESLQHEPKRVGVKSTLKELSKLHLAFCKNEASVNGQIVQTPRHILFFRISVDDTLQIVRTLKDDMDIERHPLTKSLILIAAAVTKLDRETYHKELKLPNA